MSNGPIRAYSRANGPVRVVYHNPVFPDQPSLKDKIQAMAYRERAREIDKADLRGVRGFSSGMRHAR